MTYSLALAATIATAADMLAWILLIWPNRVAEGNPLVAEMSREGAAGARLLVILVCWAFAIAAQQRQSRTLTLAAIAVLAVATVVGVVGAAVTLAVVL